MPLITVEVHLNFLTNQCINTKIRVYCNTMLKYSAYSKKKSVSEILFLMPKTPRKSEYSKSISEIAKYTPKSVLIQDILY